MPDLAEIQKTLAKMTSTSSPSPQHQMLSADNESQHQQGATETCPEEEERKARELTQTDRLNNILLKSFLQRINASEAPAVANGTDNDADDDRSAEFDE